MHADHSNQSDRGLCRGDWICRRRPVAREQRSEAVVIVHARKPAPQFAPAAGFVVGSDLLLPRPRSLPFVMFPSRHFTRLRPFRIGGPHPFAYHSRAEAELRFEGRVPSWPMQNFSRRIWSAPRKARGSGKSAYRCSPPPCWNWSGIRSARTTATAARCCLWRVEIPVH